MYYVPCTPCTYAQCTDVDLTTLLVSFIPAELKRNIYSMAAIQLCWRSIVVRRSALKMVVRGGRRDAACKYSSRQQRAAEQRGLPPSTLQLLQAAGHSSSGRTDRREHTYVLRAERKNTEAVLRGGLGGGTTDTSTNISKKEG